MKDIFDREVQVGDYIAAGMSLGHSSVLRVGRVLKITDTLNWNKQPSGRQSVRVRWRNNGKSNSRYDVKDSNIIADNGHSYAKVIILDPDFVEHYAPDIEDFR